MINQTVFAVCPCTYTFLQDLKQRKIDYKSDYKTPHMMMYSGRIDWQRLAIEMYAIEELRSKLAGETDPVLIKFLKREIEYRERLMDLDEY